jgi:hypothetical protein
MIYARQGAGKSSLLGTYENAFILDFDKGLHRSIAKAPSYTPANWKEFMKAFPELQHKLADIELLAIDTVLPMIAMIGVHCVTEDPRLGEVTQNLRLWGAIKHYADTFFAMLETFPIDLLFMAHLEEKESGKVTVVRPDIAGASYKYLLRKCDYNGILQMQGDSPSTIKRTLSFDYVENAETKNPTQTKPIDVPYFVPGDNFLGDVYNRLREELYEMEVRIHENTMHMKGLIAQVKNATTVNDLNNIIKQAGALSTPMKLIIKDKLMKKGAELNASFNSRTSSFVHLDNPIVNDPA